MKVLALSLLLLLSFSCLLKKETEKGKIEKGKEKIQITEITIESAQSYKYDLKNEIYTVFFFSKKPLEVKFSLSKEEKEEVFEKYHSLELNSDAKEINFDGNCPNAPTLYTTILIKSIELSQKIQISGSCDYSNTPNRYKVDQVMDFIKLVRDMVGSKPGVKNAPKSDIIYY